ncbi:hypothetical protein DFH11DRAFT_1749363 [Phellopilus nigrolimitatus]|nr:hypothetical protein DFH11DRAFT_1749363 [Phellopilus nigrolimitatus]
MCVLVLLVVFPVPVPLVVRAERPPAPPTESAAQRPAVPPKDQKGINARRHAQSRRRRRGPARGLKRRRRRCRCGALHNVRPPSPYPPRAPHPRPRSRHTLTPHASLPRGPHSAQTRARAYAARAAAREQRLRAHAHADVRGPELVRCRLCGQDIKLSTKSAYDAFHWTKHIERCARRAPAKRGQGASRARGDRKKRSSVSADALQPPAKHGALTIRLRPKRGGEPGPSTNTNTNTRASGGGVFVKEESPDGDSAMGLGLGALPASSSGSHGGSHQDSSPLPETPPPPPPPPHQRAPEPDVVLEDYYRRSRRRGTRELSPFTPAGARAWTWGHVKEAVWVVRKYPAAGGAGDDEVAGDEGAGAGEEVGEEVEMGGEGAGDACAGSDAGDVVRLATTGAAGGGVRPPPGASPGRTEKQQQQQQQLPPPQGGGVSSFCLPCAIRHPSPTPPLSPSRASPTSVSALSRPSGYLASTPRIFSAQLYHHTSPAVAAHDVPLLVPHHAMPRHAPARARPELHAVSVYVYLRYPTAQTGVSRRRARVVVVVVVVATSQICSAPSPEFPGARRGAGGCPAPTTKVWLALSAPSTTLDGASSRREGAARRQRDPECRSKHNNKREKGPGALAFLVQKTKCERGPSRYLLRLSARWFLNRGVGSAVRSKQPRSTAESSFNTKSALCCTQYMFLTARSQVNFNENPHAHAPPTGGGPTSAPSPKRKLDKRGFDFYGRPWICAAALRALVLLAARFARAGWDEPSQPRGAAWRVSGFACFGAGGVDVRARARAQIWMWENGLGREDGDG